MIHPDDVPRLACPDCRGALRLSGADQKSAPLDGTLTCACCNAAWPVASGIPHLVRDETVRGTDRLLRVIYDRLGALHDPAVRLTLPLFSAGREGPLRERWMRALRLDALRPHADGAPVRILDIGVGTGADLPFLAAALPPRLPVELWGLDLSAGMLARCRRRLAKGPLPPVRLVLGDAHALPFPDGTFDRVFHIGGLNGCRDQRRALAEMARVAAPGTPIVAVDEQLDPAARNTLYHRAAFRLVTFYDADPHCPVELLPPGAADVRVEQTGRFFYCLSFTA